MFDLNKVIQTGKAAMMGEIQKQMGQVSQQIVQGLLTPEMLYGCMNTLLESLGAMGLDSSQFRGQRGKQMGLDPYQILSLSELASDEEVRNRYRFLMSRLHPDRAGSELEFLATLVNVAYQEICQRRGMK